MTGRFAIAIACVAWAACGAGDDTNEGTRARCAQGGALTDCPDENAYYAAGIDLFLAGVSTLSRQGSATERRAQDQRRG